MTGTTRSPPARGRTWIPVPAGGLPDRPRPRGAARIVDNLKAQLSTRWPSIVQELRSYGDLSLPAFLNESGMESPDSCDGQRPGQTTPRGWPPRTDWHRRPSRGRSAASRPSCSPTSMTRFGRGFLAARRLAPLYASLSPANSGSQGCSSSRSGPTAAASFDRCWLRRSSSGACDPVRDPGRDRPRLRRRAPRLAGSPAVLPRFG